MVAGFDADEDGTLDANEETHEIDVHVVKVNSSSITDMSDGFVASNPSATEMWVAENSTTGSDDIEIHGDFLPTTSAAGTHVLWDVLGGANDGSPPKNLAAVMRSLRSLPARAVGITTSRLVSTTTTTRRLRPAKSTG